jgi:hypothetical protein
MAEKSALYQKAVEDIARITGELTAAQSEEPLDDAKIQQLRDKLAAATQIKNDNAPPDDGGDEKWEVHFDISDGKPFWYNTKNQETTWDKPAGAPDPDPTAAKAAAEKAAAAKAADADPPADPANPPPADPANPPPGENNHMEDIDLYKKVTNNFYKGIDGNPNYWLTADFVNAFGEITNEDKDNYKYYKTESIIFKGTFEYYKDNDKMTNIQFTKDNLIKEINGVDIIETIQKQIDDDGQPEGEGVSIKCTFEFTAHICNSTENVTPSSITYKAIPLAFAKTGILDISNITITGQRVHEYKIKNIAAMALDNKIDNHEHRIFSLVVTNNQKRNTNEFLRLMQDAKTKGVSQPKIDEAIDNFIKRSGEFAGLMKEHDEEKNILEKIAPALFDIIDEALKEKFTFRGGKKRRTMKRGGKKTRRNNKRSNRRRSGRRGKRMSRR